MKEFVFTPIHTVPVDEIKRIELDNKGDKIIIVVNDQELYARKSMYDNMSLDDIYKDIQDQLRPTKEQNNDK